MKLFTDNQSAVIRKVWIPALMGAMLAAGFIVISNSDQYFSRLPYSVTRIFNNSFSPMMIWLPIVFVTFNLEFFVLQYKQRIICTVSSAALLAAAWGLSEMQDSIGTGNNGFYLTILIWIGLLLIRTFALGKKDNKSILAALIAAVAFSVMPVMHTLLNHYTGLVGLHSYVEIEVLYMNTVFPVLYYLFIFFAENLTDKNYIKVLRSKLTVVDKYSYLFLFVGLYALLMPATRVVADLLSMSSRTSMGFLLTNVFMVTRIIYAIGVLLFVPYVLRNIIVARSLTINNPNRFFFFLHIIPVANIIAVFYYYSTPDVNATEGDNGVAYMKEPMSVLRYVIIATALLSTIWQLWNAGRMEDAGLFMGIAIAKVVLMVIMIKQEWAVYVIMAFVLLPLFFTRYYEPQTAALAILQCVLSIQAFLEIFHPSLEDADAEIYLKEEAAIGEELVVGMD